MNLPEFRCTECGGTGSADYPPPVPTSKEDITVKVCMRCIGIDTAVVDQLGYRYDPDFEDELREKFDLVSLPLPWDAVERFTVKTSCATWVVTVVDDEIEMRKVAAAGPWWSPATELCIDDTPATDLTENLRARSRCLAATVHPERVDMPVRTALCFTSAMWGSINSSVVIGNVLFCWPASLRRHLLNEVEGPDAIASVKEFISTLKGETQPVS